MLTDLIKTHLNEAILAKDEIKVSTLRFLLSEIRNCQIEKQKDLTDEDIVTVIRRGIKQRQESIEAFKKGKREDLVKKEEAEMDILSKYLPRQMSTEELELLVKQTIKEIGVVGPKDFGRIMGAVMAKAKGGADGSVVAEVVKKSLTAS